MLEETAFVGPGPRGGLTASPSPFPQAKVAFREEGGRFLVRALPGEPPPDVNGAPGDGTFLADGARVRLGDQVVLFRTSATATLTPPVATLAAPAPAAAPARPRRAVAAARAGGVPEGSRQAARALMLFGLVLLLFAAYQAVRLLQTPGPSAVPFVTEAMTRVPEPVVPRTEEQAAKAYADAEAAETAAAADVEGALARYGSVVRNHPGTAAALRASAKVTELWPRLAERAWARVRPEIEAAARGGRYRKALAALDEFDARFGGTDAAVAAGPLRETVRTEARAAVDGLRQRAAPLIASDPTRAYKVLTQSGLDFPPDLEAELAALIAKVRERWDDPSAPNGGAPGTGPGATPKGPTPPGATPPRPLVPPDAPPSPVPPAGGDREAAAKAAWAAAREHLLARRYAEAKKAYGAVLKEFKDSATVAAGGEKLRAGRRAADAGLRGAAAFCSEDATFEGGRLTAEWQFEDDKGFLADFELLQPFAGEEATQAQCREGMAILSGSTSMLLKVVFDPTDVSWEMEATSDEPHDFGLIGVQEGKEYRTCAMHVGNTQFRLKKGAAAQVLAGHVLWLFGDGVWKDADAGERGFVRLAVRNGNDLKRDEVFRVRAELHGGQMTGEIHSKNDPVDLKGPMKGDDGRGIGPLKVGPFAYKGRVGVRRFQVSGRVDAAWLDKALADLVAADPGP